MQKSLISPSEELLREIRNLAALFLTPREIAMMLELPVEPFVQECNTENSRYYEAFQCGRLQSEVDLRTGILKLAKSGSSPAQTMAMDLLNKSKLKLLDR